MKKHIVQRLAPQKSTTYLILQLSCGSSRVKAMKKIEERLKELGIRATAIRLQILEILSKRKGPVSQPELSSNSKLASFDKVTIYRTLELLKKHKLINQTLSSDGIWHFCAASDDHSAHQCGGNHLHFYCLKCKKMLCLPEFKLPWIEVPAGMKIINKQLLVQGLCEKCLAKENEK